MSFSGLENEFQARISLKIMSLLSRIRDFFSTSSGTGTDWRTDHDGDLSVAWFTRGADPVYPIFSQPLAVSSQALGITDLDAPSAEEQRSAYRGLISTLVGMRAQEIASAMVRVKVQRQVGDGEYENVELEHPWCKLMRQPSRNLSGFEFWEDVSRMQDMGPGAFLLVGIGAMGIPDGLFAIYPEFGEVKAVGQTDGGIGGFVHYAQGGSVQQIKRELMIWLRHGHPVSPYEGASLLEQAAYNSDIALYQAVYARDLTKEGNVPPVYAKADAMITIDQAKKYGQYLTQEYFTAGKRKKTMVVGHGMELKTLSVNPNDLQYIEAAQLNDHQIMRIFGFPPAMFEASGVVANSREVRRQWLQNSIQRSVDKLCASLTHQFKIIFDAMDSDLCIKAPDVVPIDEAERARIREFQLRTGIRNPNEFRMEDGLGTYPEGDTFFIGGSLRPVAEMVGTGSTGGDGQSPEEDAEL